MNKLLASILILIFVNPAGAQIIGNQSGVFVVNPRSDEPANVSSEGDRGNTPPLEEIPAEASPTPYNEVRLALFAVLKITKDDELVDFGCGHDGRVAITANIGTGCKAIGIEIDPGRAASARLRVEQLSLTDVTIIEGDATEVETTANVGFAYLYPWVLERLKYKIIHLDRFASYLHRVPGLPMKKIGNIWYYEKSMLKVDEVAEWNGQEYSAVVCGDPNCVMCYGPGGIQDQLNQKKLHNAELDKLLQSVVPKVKEEKTQAAVTYTDQTYRVECTRKYCIYETWRTFSDGSQTRINRYRVNN